MANIFQLGTAPESLTDAQKQDLEKIAILEATITGSVQELTPGETIQRIGSNRLYSVGGVKMLLAFNGASAPYVVPNPITVADLAKWAVTSQYPATATNFPANAIVPAGFQLQYQGSIRRHTATRMTGSAIDLANWEVEVPSTATIDDWIKNAGDDHAAGEKLFKADDRRISVGGVGVRMTYRGADTDSCPALSVGELSNWEYVGQALIPTTYPANALAIKGFRYRHSNGQIFQVKGHSTLAATFDPNQWETVSGANVRILNGVNFDILTALSIVETEGVFDRVPQLANGPNNAAQNVSGYWRVIGDSKNGLIMLTISDGNNIDKLAGDWVLRVSTDAQNVTTVGSWRKLLPGGNYKNSANNLAVFTPDKIYWNLAHNLTVSFVDDGSISLLPIGDWSERTGTITATGGATVFGQFPLSGSDEIELHYDPTTLRYNIREASSSNRASTVHNSGLTTSIALKGSTHHMAEVHVEGGKDYTIAAADWADGQWFRLVQTAGTNTTEKLLPSGFAGAFLRDSKSSNIAAGLEIGQRDAQFLCTITNNGGNKFLNVSDRTALATRVATAETAIASAIANWASDRQYRADQITIRNKTFFLCLKDNIGNDPLTDTAGNWSVFNPGSSSDMFANRSPVATDVHPAGTKWWDVSFGADTPLGFVSLGNGAWQFLNQISLSKIRFFGYGINSTYQSNLNSIKFLKADGTQIPDGWFVWGASSGLGKPTTGTAFSGQNITGAYNASGWADLEPSSLFDLSVNITKITASSGYFAFTKLQFIYDNGGIKTFSSLGDLSPVPQSRYGDSIAAALGETLTAVKLSDANSTDPGRLTGEAFVSAWSVLYQSQPKTTPTVHNFGVTADIPLTGALHDGAEAHIENGADYTIDAADWEDGQSLSFIHTAGSVTPEELKLTGFTRAYYRDGKSTEIVAPLAIGTIIDANYKATITDNGGFKFFNIWIENDGITGSAGIAHAYLNATDRAAGTGYTPTAADVTEANLFLELDTNTLWRCTDDSPLTWVQVSGGVPELTDAQAKDAASDVFGTVSGERLTDAIRSKTEQVNAQFSTGTTIDVTTLGLVKNQRLYLYSSTGAAAQLKVRFNDTFNKTVSVNGATGTTVGNVVTIEGVQRAIVYQEFADASSVGGTTQIVCDPGSASTRPVFTGVNTDQGLATWQANAKAGDVAEDIRAGTIHESRGSGGALRLTPNWIDRMDYTVTSATSIADGLVAGSLISGMNGVAFLRGSRERKTIIKQAAPTTLGALFTAINASLAAGTLTNITEIGYRRSVAASWLYYDTTVPADAAIAVPSGWYVVSFPGHTEINVEPLATQVSQIILYTGATPDTPPNITLPAIALNTTTRKITHYWNTGTVAWVTLLTSVTPQPSNYTVNTSAPRFYKPTTTVAGGGTRSGGKVTPPALTTDFLMEDGDWDSELQLPANPTQGRLFNFRNNATLTATVLSTGSNMPSNLSVATGQSLHFVANAGGVWEWIAIPMPSTIGHSTTEHFTGEYWTDGKPIYRRIWTGTTPNNTSDNNLFTVTGATEIVRFFGRVVNSTNRVADMFGVYSGNAPHGPAAQFYGNDLHWYNATGDTRWQNGAYVVTVWYTK